MHKITVFIRGMHCRSCELLVEGELKNIPGVNKVNVNYKEGRADVFFDKNMPLGESIRQAIKNAGYDLGRKDNLEWISKDKNDYIHLLKGAFILLAFYLVAKWLGLLDLAINTESTGLVVVLVVGLVAGISTCMALVGGLVMGISARHAELHPEISPIEKFRPHVYFNLGRILGFGFLGGLIGLVGSSIGLSINTMGFMTIVAGGVLIFLGLKLIEIFPALKEKSFSLPKSISNFFGLHKEQKEYSHKGALIAGALTFFLPCGFTQAMQIYAVGTRSFLRGALVMSLFALGTTPGLLGIGGLASIFQKKKARVFFAAVGLAVIFLGVYNIANGSRLISFVKTPANSSGNIQNFQVVKMTQGSYGYSPNIFTVKVGQPVRWVITSENPFSCASSLVIPRYGISRSLQQGENIIEFTPTEVGEISFSCSMGMYRGKFIVVESGVNSLGQNSAAGQSAVAMPRGGGCGMNGGGCGCGVRARKFN